ncbi:MAG TPA: methylenetetrahydrofolate reductase [NAD(P)H] [Gemmataceae bacterium]|nr:methylenetetrahydrofolate reductase [NAD(P)H] [Gemmataceae bacterium]
MDQFSVVDPIIVEPSHGVERLRIRDLYESPKPVISFEFFPPKNEAAIETLFAETVPALKSLNPAFISVTYGAGGSTRGTTTSVVQRIREKHGIESMPHLTCVGSTKEMLGNFLDEVIKLGFENVLALRGDPPKDQATFQATEGGFANATDLIRFIRSHSKIGIGAACYPEGHVEARFKHQDWDFAADKVEAGAEFLITQLFYDWSDFLDMEDYLRNKRNVKVPIVPGILPFLNASQIKRFTSLCGSKLPLAIRSKIEKYADDDESVRKLGVEVCTEICAKLMNRVAGFHFYCLNRATSSAEVLRNLGLAT